MSLPSAVPIDIGRAEAAEAARRELAKSVYAQDRPSLLQRILNWVVDQVIHAVTAVASVAPGGLLGLLVLGGLMALVVFLVLRRTGGLHGSAADEVPLFVGRPRSAAQYRSAADTAASAGDWDEAVRQRFRAVVRVLEERDILEPRPGRTADEAATEAARALPSCAAGLRAAARSFDDVAYGGQARDQQADADLRELDRQVTSARPAHAAELPGALAPVR